MPKRKASADAEKEDTEMDPADEGVDDGGGGDDAKGTTVNTSRAAKSSKKRSRNADGDDDGDDENGSNQNKQQVKKKRLKGPEPVQKPTENDEESANSDANASAMKEEEMEEDEDAQDKDAAKKNGNGVAEAKSPATKKAGGKKKTPAKKPRTPAKKTPAKKTPAKASQSDEEEEDVPVPPQGLATNAAPVAVNAPAASAKKSTKKNRGQAKIVVNGSATPADTFESEAQQEEVEEPAVSSDFFARKIVWFVIFLLLELTIYSLYVYPSTVGSADYLLHMYKTGVSYLAPLTTEKRNQTELDLQSEQERQGKRDALKKLKDAQASLQAHILVMEKESKDAKDDTDDLKQRIEDHKEPAEKLRSRLHRIELLLEGKTKGDIKNAMTALGHIKKALGENDENKLLDLSNLDVWEIAEIPEGCNDGEANEIGEDSEDSISADSGDYDEGSTVIDQDGLHEWLQEFQELVNTSTDEILKDDGVSRQVKTWVRSEIKKEVNWDKTLAKYTVEEVTKLIKKEMASKGSSASGSLDSDDIVKQIQERLELVVADQTGRYDFASIRNGAAVILEGPRATSRSLVRDLPLFNRLLAHTGLRFYGHGAEAALIPTDPPGALGQCWSFQSEGNLMKRRKRSPATQDFSRGTVATLAVRLARPAYVHSVVIEHPPREITDRIQSAIRAFRIVGYEDDVATKGSYELGRYEYKIGEENPRMEFSVARKMSRQNVPKLKSVVLAVESTWGEPGDYGCLYRFRVHGSDDE